MRNPIRWGVGVISFAIMLPLLTGCDQGDLGWDTARDAVGAIEGDRMQIDKRWRDYRVAVVEDLDELKAVLGSAQRQMGVGERAQVGELNDRIAMLRRDMIAEIDEPADRAMATRARLERDFEALRSDVNALLTRLGIDRGELAKWPAGG